MPTPIESQRQADQKRDQEIRAFCELLRLSWVQTPELSFTEFMEQAGNPDLTSYDDGEQYAILQKLYHDGPHDGLEVVADCEGLWASGKVEVSSSSTGRRNVWTQA